MSALTVGQRTLLTGTVGTSPITVLTANTARNYLRVHNPSGTAFLAVTYDGVTAPVINGAGITINPLWEDCNEIHVPVGAVQIVSSGSSTPYTIEYS
jgi:hypothetical protein